MPGTVVVVSKPVLGRVEEKDEPFGVEMLDKFLHVFEAAEEKPGAIAFYTEGVKVACKGSPALLTLRLLEQMGVKMVVCKSCLDYYGLAEKRAVGEVVGMNDIVSLLTGAEVVLYP
jgi:predicted peroxiredoxin